MKYKIFFFFLLIALLPLCNTQHTEDLYEYDNKCLGEDKFVCISGGCVLLSQLCDGRIDCDDGTDESFCNQPTDNLMCTAVNQYMCADKSRCIPNTWVCNSIAECVDSSDEENCTAFVPNNKSCKGFQCGDGKCISKLWACDGKYDCADKSDELSLELCRRHTPIHLIHDGSLCDDWSLLTFNYSKRYRCVDASFCLPIDMMCDGIPDCRDGSDEGPFCDNWHTMCTNSCIGEGLKCFPERYGPQCVCPRNASTTLYDPTTKRCDDIDECTLDVVVCAHRCINKRGHYKCECDSGFTSDTYEYLCYAGDPEAVLYFTTRNEIKYVKIKSKTVGTLLTDVKEPHGVTVDGTYMYWVQTAQGHQAILRAKLSDVEGTKEVLVGLGLEDPGDIAIDWYGGNFFFSDAERGIIAACALNGSMCTTVPVPSKHPRFVTLDVRNGKMYWADWNDAPVLKVANMDGSRSMILAENLDTFPTGLTVDVPNGRLYFVDRIVKAVILSTKRVYSLFEEPFNHPYSIAVFENTVFWSDWTSNSILTTDKVHGVRRKKNILVTLKTPVMGMHLYHPAQMIKPLKPLCEDHNCSHFCFPTSNQTTACGCPDGMYLKDKRFCTPQKDLRRAYLIVAGGQQFTKIEYNTLGNPENHATRFDIGRVQAMAFDSNQDVLYIYDGQRKAICYINMKDFQFGTAVLLIYTGLENVVDLDFDFSTKSLYILDAGRNFIEVYSLRTKKRALLHRFGEQETPLSFCLMPDYGRMMLAILENDQGQHIHIDSIGLNGEDRQHLVVSNLKGPEIRLRYVAHLDNVFISDEGNGIIEIIHPLGTGRENFRELTTTVTSMAIVGRYAFWTNRRTPRLFWTDINEVTQRIRSIDLPFFPNNTQLLVQATTLKVDPSHPLTAHPCVANVCSDVCVQTPHLPDLSLTLGYKCLCSPGLLLMNGVCTHLITCMDKELYCHMSNTCVKKGVHCDGKKDCPHGEDEENCSKPVKSCTAQEIFCEGVCVKKGSNSTCENNKQGQEDNPEGEFKLSVCTEVEFQCGNTSICLSRSQVCDGTADCPDGSDEDRGRCNIFTCLSNEFMCTSGSCILKSWQCDGDNDCMDLSDEINCGVPKCVIGKFQCKNKACVDIGKRCDGFPDCYDFSDEDQCEEKMPIEKPPPACGQWEYACALNKSICLPLSARCNLHVECPGGTDESGCDYSCAHKGMFSCHQQLKCVPWRKVCDGNRDCSDSSDETPQACHIVRRAPQMFVDTEKSWLCDEYQCNNGQCIEWKEVCNTKEQCSDGTDEGRSCGSACDNNYCSHACQPTPRGPRCYCPVGFELDKQGACVDVDECEQDLCSQGCINVHGSFICICHRGYMMRPDRRSCKAMHGNMTVLYASENAVNSVSSVGYAAMEYIHSSGSNIFDLDINARQGGFYLTIPDTGELIEVGNDHNITIVTNVGTPTRVAVEWVTGNVYFVDSTPAASSMRVCNVQKKRCAVLQKLPSTAKVSALAVDPSSRQLFYCLTRGADSVVWSSSLTGGNTADIATVRNCTGLAVNSFNRKLYVAESHPDQIIRMNYEGEMHKKIVVDQPHLQSPQGLVLFEDYAYFMAADTHKLSRCTLHGRPRCETYIFSMYQASSFVIKHESAQRDDIKNDCESFKCSNVCVLTKNGPKCLCHDGFYAINGVCVVTDSATLPLFNGWSYEGVVTHYTLLIFAIVAISLVILYMIASAYYYLVIYPRRNRPAHFLEVRYESSVPGNSGDPTVVIHAQNPGQQGLRNPVTFMTNLWQRLSSRRRARPVGTAALNIDIAAIRAQQDTPSSSTETELMSGP